jgi:hypothetical protein
MGEFKAGKGRDESLQNREVLIEIDFITLLIVGRFSL